MFYFLMILLAIFMGPASIPIIIIAVTIRNAARGKYGKRANRPYDGAGRSNHWS